LLPDAPGGEVNDSDLLVARSERGMCLVVCFSPRHDLTLAEMSAEEITSVVEAWSEQYAELGMSPFINYVQIFENKGSIMGCSNPHPHGQIWATEHVPVEPEKELARQAAYLEEKASCLLCDYLKLEVREGERIVCTNEDFVALVPFWACWPFETIVLPRRHVGNITGLSWRERRSLADVLLRLTVRYDNLFETSFPYSAGWHQSPTDGSAHGEWHLHGHFYPPLLRSATVKKFMVGFEMLANPQRDITPEAAAERLRGLSEVHFKKAAFGPQTRRPEGGR
jgi:UDPglucose--hexose-1-phosphate uridylyltransferase